MKNLKIYTIFCLSGYRDSNAGPPAPKAGALTGLRYTPKPLSGTKVRIISQSAIPSPQEKPLGEGVARGRSDPGGIQTHDLQNRNLTLYSAKLPSLLLPLCALQRYIFLPNRLIPLCSRIETIAPICLLYEKKKSSLPPPKVGGDGSSLFCGATHSLLWIRFCVDNLAPYLSSWMGARVDVIICVNSLFRQYTSFLVSWCE